MQHLVRLVDDLLDVARINHNRLELRREVVDLAEVVRQAVETCRPLLDSLQHELLVSLPATPVQLYADPVRLAQVLGNLLNNAAKYTAPGGQIEVRAATWRRRRGDHGTGQRHRHPRGDAASGVRNVHRSSTARSNDRTAASASG